MLEEKTGFFLTQKLTIIIPKKKIEHLEAIENTLVDFLPVGKNIDIQFQEEIRRESSKSDESSVTIQYASIPDNDSPEAYAINIAEDIVEIIAPNDSGIFYALQTLLQLVKIDETTKKICIPCCRIVDWPAFPIRGLMHDVGRNFISLDRLKNQMRIFAQYKINTFHWHLTDVPAFRIESRTFPELNDPKYHMITRNPGKFYTYEEMHDFIAFCKRLHITVIPEIDVPGHSKYFRRVFKTGMNSRKGMRILQQIFAEFFSEFSTEEFPYIHIGSDETHIINPKKFILFITQIVQKSEREVIMWNPGLKPPSNAILHNWGRSKQITQRYIDSKPFYLNNMELFSGIVQIFYSQPCRVASFEQSNGLALGSILCLWPDVNVEDESTTERYNFLYPAIITFSERSWRGNKNKAPEYLGTLPADDIDSFMEFVEFENRFLHHRDLLSSLVFFPYVKQNQLKWKIIGPFNKGTIKSISEPPNQEMLISYAQKDENIRLINARGASIHLASRNETSSYFPDIEKGFVYAATCIHSQKEQNIDVWIGFETPVRSNRQYRGIPRHKEWDPNGGKIWLNDTPLEPPNWENAGKYSYPLHASWNLPRHEIPYIDEEFFWTRKPYILPLKQGWNNFLVKIVKSYPKQNWIFTFVPLLIEDGKIREKSDLEFSANCDFNDPVV